MKISASVFSNPDRPLEGLVQELEACGVDYIHIDCNDDPAVGEAIGRIRQVSPLPIDLHIIAAEPEKYYGMIAEQQVDMVTLQYEDLRGRVPEMPDLGCSWGLSLVTTTEAACFDDFAERCDFVLFMTTTPGQSGGKFAPANFRRIRQFRFAHPDKRIHVDGGVNAEISFVLRNLGVFCAVSGSFLVKANSIDRAFLNLLVQKGTNHLRVRDFMAERNELPVLPQDGLELGPLLRTIEQYKKGYCLLVDDTGRLAGLSSNADIRRGLIRHVGNLDQVDVQAMVNRQPKHIHPEATVTEMLRFIKSFPFLVLYLPVVDGDGTLVGAVNFNNLILGEL